MIVTTRCDSCYHYFIVCGRCGRPKKDNEHNFCSHCGADYSKTEIDWGSDEKARVGGDHE